MSVQMEVNATTFGLVVPGKCDVAGLLVGWM